MSTLPTIIPHSPTSTPATPVQQTLAPFRLRRHADYQRVYQASRKHFSASMAYFFRLRPSDSVALPTSPAALPSATVVVVGPRVGLTVGRVLGKAVTRNRIKRRMREAVRLHLAILHHTALPIDLVLHPRISVAEMDFAALEQEVARLFNQVAAMAVTPITRTSSSQPRQSGRRRKPGTGPKPSNRIQTPHPLDGPRP